MSIREYNPALELIALRHASTLGSVPAARGVVGTPDDDADYFLVGREPAVFRHRARAICPDPRMHLFWDENAQKVTCRPCSPGEARDPHDPFTCSLIPIGKRQWVGA